MTEGTPFGAYAGFYDALYADKDYEAECDFVVAVLQEAGIGTGARVLDLGCGTGGHLVPLSQRGYAMTGVDRAVEMLGRAAEKLSASGVRAELVTADIRDVNLGGRFDAVLSMFGVVSYLITDDDVMRTFRAARRHLDVGGLFLFDVWHGPAVLAQRPEVKTKTVASAEGEIVRVATPTLDEAARTVEVAYEVTERSGAEVRHSTAESHRMRFFFGEELARMLADAGFTDVRVGPFGDLSREATDADWNVSVVARAGG